MTRRTIVQSLSKSVLTSVFVDVLPFRPDQNNHCSHCFVSSFCPEVTMEISAPPHLWRNMCGECGGCAWVCPGMWCQRFWCCLCVCVCVWGVARGGQVLVVMVVGGDGGALAPFGGSAVELEVGPAPQRFTGPQLRPGGFKFANSL